LLSFTTHKTVIYSADDYTATFIRLLKERYISHIYNLFKSQFIMFYKIISEVKTTIQTIGIIIILLTILLPIAIGILSFFFPILKETTGFIQSAGDISMHIILIGLFTLFVLSLIEYFNRILLWELVPANTKLLKKENKIRTISRTTIGDNSHTETYDEKYIEYTFNIYYQSQKGQNFEYLYVTEDNLSSKILKIHHHPELEELAFIYSLKNYIWTAIYLLLTLPISYYIGRYYLVSSSKGDISILLIVLGCIIYSAIMSKEPVFFKNLVTQDTTKA